MEVPSWYIRMFSPEFRKARKILKRTIEEDEGMWGKKEEREKMQRKMCEDAFEAVDFEAMRPHLNSPQAHTVYRRLCQDIRDIFLNTYKEIPQKTGDLILKFYYEEFYKYNPITQWAVRNLPGAKELAARSKAVKLFCGGCLVGYYIVDSCYPSSKGNIGA